MLSRAEHQRLEKIFFVSSVSAYIPFTELAVLAASIC